MKTPVYLCLALLAVAPASAQVFRPETVNGAVLGGIAGAVIGNNSRSLGHNAWRGAAYGAGAGLLPDGAVAQAVSSAWNAAAFGAGIAGLPLNEPTSSTEASSISTVAISHGPAANPFHSGATGGTARKAITSQPKVAKATSE